MNKAAFSPHFLQRALFGVRLEIQNISEYRITARHKEGVYTIGIHIRIRSHAQSYVLSAP
jgi:hypothetical protein